MLLDKHFLMKILKVLLSQPQLNHNSTQPNLTKHENYFTPPPPTATQKQYEQYISDFNSSDFDQTLKLVFLGQQKQQHQQKQQQQKTTISKLLLA